MSRGIRSVLCVQTVRRSWLVNTSPLEMTAPIALSALAACMPRSVRPAANRLQVLEEESTSHLKIVSGISRASPAPSAPSRSWVLAFSQMVTESCAVNATATYKALTYPDLTIPSVLQQRF
ncbi:hypothetical protein XENOCAPTIV_030271 [Xenoophorus captivus]|uniref:Uncharacterized protein n=1 Tax=Xenoophorus captivus TaxID=1517983 RepID=A0ABV0Q6X5_9TELE